MYLGVVVRLVFFLLAIANVFLVWRHYDELMLIGEPTGAEVSMKLPVEEVARSDATSATSELTPTVELLPAGQPADVAGTSLTELTPEPRQCYWAGPLAAEESAGQILMDRLQSLRIEVSDHRVRMRGPDRFWVLIPKAAVKGKVSQLIADLKKANIDSYEIARGEHGGAISLGFYSRQALAEARLAEAASLGLAAEVVRVETNKHQQWLQVDKQQADAVGEGILARMVKNNSGVEIIEKKCEFPVASHNNIL